MKIERKSEPTTSLERVLRSDIDKAGSDRAAKATIGSTICVETHEKELTYPWVLGKLVDSSTPLSKGKDKSAPCIQFETRRAAEKMARMRLFEGLEAGSRVYTLSDHVIEVPARCVRVL